MSFFLVVNVLFLIALIIHVCVIAYSMIYPSVPSVKIYKRSYNEIEFPISIKICATEDRESDIMRHNISGYERNFMFFLGQSMFNESLIGWSGHTENGSFLGSAEGKKKSMLMNNEPKLSCFYERYNKKFFTRDGEDSNSSNVL